MLLTFKIFGKKKQSNKKPKSLRISYSSKNIRADATTDGRFDSGIIAPAATFDLTFTEAGE